MNAAAVEFNAERHEYRVAGRVWPSVTQLLEPLQLLDGIPQPLLDAAAHFGRHVHHACYLFDLGRLHWPSLDAPLVPYVRAWERYLRESGCVIVASELIVANHELEYCGTVDAIGRLNARNVLIDRKSGAIPFTVGAQTRAYAEAFGQSRIARRVVQLRPDGSYGSHALTDARDWNDFLTAYNLNAWRTRHGRSPVNA